MKYECCDVLYETAYLTKTCNLFLINLPWKSFLIEIDTIKNHPHPDGVF